MYRYSRTGVAWSRPDASNAIAVGIRTWSSQPASPETTCSMREAALGELGRRGPGSPPVSGSGGRGRDDAAAGDERAEEQAGEGQAIGGTSSRRLPPDRAAVRPAVARPPLRVAEAGDRVGGRVAVGRSGWRWSGVRRGGSGAAGPAGVGEAAVTGGAAPAAPCVGAALAEPTGGAARIAALEASPAARSARQRTGSRPRRFAARSTRRRPPNPVTQPRAATSSRRPTDTRRRAMSSGHSSSARTSSSGHRSVNRLVAVRSCIHGSSGRHDPVPPVAARSGGEERLVRPEQAVLGGRRGNQPDRPPERR